MQKGASDDGVGRRIKLGEGVVSSEDRMMMRMMSVIIVLMMTMMTMMMKALRWSRQARRIK